MLPWTPGFGYLAAELRLSLPMRPWRHVSPTVGGRRVSATGIPAAYMVRRDAVLEVTIRCYEHEWPAVLAMIAYGQAAGVLTFTPDLAVPGVSREVYLDAPEMGEDVAPERDPDYLDVLTITLRLRAVDGEPWDLRYMEG
jgi:hypothetical protein